MSSTTAAVCPLARAIRASAVRSGASSSSARATSCAAYEVRLCLSSQPRVSRGSPSGISPPESRANRRGRLSPAVLSLRPGLPRNEAPTPFGRWRDAARADYPHVRRGSQPRGLRVRIRRGTRPERRRRRRALGGVGCARVTQHVGRATGRLVRATQSAPRNRLRAVNSSILGRAALAASSANAYSERLCPAAAARTFSVRKISSGTFRI